MKIERKVWGSGVLAIGLLLRAIVGFGQDYPTRPVQIIVPSTAGGGLDLLVKAVQPRLAELLG